MLGSDYDSSSTKTFTCRSVTFIFMTISGDDDINYDLISTITFACLAVTMILALQ